MKKRLVLRKEIKEELENEGLAILGIIAGLIICYVLCLIF